jgi:hypothetical protein
MTVPVGAWTMRASMVFLASGMAWQAGAGAPAEGRPFP